MFVRMEQLGSKLMTFHENCYLSIFKKICWGSHFY